VLRVDRSAQEKTGQKVTYVVKHHMWTPHLKKWGSIDPLDPVAPQPLTDTPEVTAEAGITKKYFYYRSISISME